MRSVGLVLSGCVLMLAGCPQSDYVSTLSPTIEEVDAIRNDADLSAQEKREELRFLGLSETTINALLRTERLGNQFGGDLRSAFEKVTGGELSNMTPDEVQLYSDAAIVVDSNVSPTISDQQAQAIIELFVAENIGTADDLRTLLTDPGREVPSSIPDNVLQTLFVDFDPTRIEDQL